MSSAVDSSVGGENNDIGTEYHPSISLCPFGLSYLGAGAQNTIVGGGVCDQCCMLLSACSFCVGIGKVNTFVLSH